MRESSTIISMIQLKFDEKMQALLGDEGVVSVAVAVSGGVDSMLLCYLAQQFCARHGAPLHAIIVDHGLRDKSSFEAESTKDFLQSQGLEALVLTWDGVKPQANIQAMARDKRYELMAGYCKNYGIKYLVTGHHYDDQAETVLLRIMRGSGVDGISGMEEASFRNGITLLRPMLSISRSEIIQGIKEVGWSYCDDPSNENEVFARVKVRKLLAVPSWMFMKDKLVLLARNSRRASDYLQQQMEDFLHRHCVFCQFGTALIELDAYKQQHEEIALRALAAVLMRVGGNCYPPRLLQLERVYGAIHSGMWKNATLCGCFLKIRRGKLVAIREEADIAVFTEVKAGQELLWDNRFIINADVDGYIGTIAKHNYYKELKPLLHEQQVHASPEVIATLPAFFTTDNKLVMVAGVYKDHNYDGNIFINIVNIGQP